MATVTLSVMFTDLVGSTALMSRVGEDVAEALRVEHFELLREAFAGRGGREVKNLGDGLMVTFEGTADAVAAGVAMQQAFERRNRHADEPLGIRVAIAVGDVDADGSGDVFGAPVVQAARLCGVAEGAEILCTDLTRLLAGSRVEASWESVGELELKGLDEPVASCRVVWEPLEADPVGMLPSRLGSSLAPLFVGRAKEFDQIVASFKEAVGENTRRVVLLAGEPGIGKTTLTAQVTAELADQGASVVYGRSDEGLGVSYQPWIEALGMLIDAVDESVLVEHVADRGASLARLVPRLAVKAGVDVPSGEVGESERFVLFGCVTDLLARASAAKPVVLVVDDLHWTDRQSLQLLRHVVTSGEPMRALVIGTFRDSEVLAGDPLSELLAVFHREAGVERMPLSGLGDLELLELLERTAGHEMDAAGLGLRDAVLAETAGNPFFIGEILRHLRDSGAIVQNDEGRWVGNMNLAEVGLPVSVTEVVGRRIGNLGEESRKVLAAAAVIGRDFDIATLASVSGVDEDTVVDLCDVAVDASVLAPTERLGVYTFAHALIAHTLVEGLSATRRARMHRAVADAIELGDNVEARAGELANHWANAVHVDADKVVGYELLAGRQALEQLAPDDAVDWFTRALEHHDHGTTGGDVRRVEILIGLGEAQKLSGLGDYRSTLLEASRVADRIDRPDMLARAVLANSRTWQSNIDAVDHERIHYQQCALEGADRDGTRAFLLVMTAVEQISVVDTRTRLAMAREAVGLVAGDAWNDRARVLLRACRAVVGPATLDIRDRWCNEAHRLLGDHGDPDTMHEAWMIDLAAGLEAGDPKRFRRGLAAIDDLLATNPDANRRWARMFFAVLPEELWGELTAAETLAEAALNFGTEIGQPDAFSIYGAQLLSIRAHQGRMSEMIPALEHTVAEQPDRPTYRAVLVEAVAESGDLERTRKLIDADLAVGFPMTEDSGWTTGMIYWVQAAVIAGHVDAARMIRDDLVPHAEMIVTTQLGVNPAVAYYIGRIDHLLGDFDEADRWFTIADGIHRRMESPMLIAYSDAAWAAMLVDRGRGDDVERARGLASSASKVADARGYGRIAADAGSVLALLG